MLLRRHRGPSSTLTHDVGMTPRELLLALLGTDRPADAACRGALVHGALVADWRPHLAQAESLQMIYTRRAQHLETRGIRHLGATEFPGRIAASGQSQVTLMGVHSDSWNFVVALTPDLSDLVAVIAVDARLCPRPILRRSDSERAWSGHCR